MGAGGLEVAEVGGLEDPELGTGGLNNPEEDAGGLEDPEDAGGLVDSGVRADDPADLEASIDAPGLGAGGLAMLGFKLKS